MHLTKHTHTHPYEQTGISVHTDYTEGVTKTEERKGANGIGGGIEVRSWIGHGNEDGGENGEVNGDGGRTGAGTRTKVEANEGTLDGSGDGSGNGA